MRIEGVIWLRDVVDKLAFKHHVETDEVEEVLSSQAKFRFVERGKEKVKMYIWHSAKPMPDDTWQYSLSTQKIKRH